MWTCADPRVVGTAPYTQQVRFFCRCETLDRQNLSTGRLEEKRTYTHTYTPQIQHLLAIMRVYKLYLPTYYGRPA